MYVKDEILLFQTPQHIHTQKEKVKWPSTTTTMSTPHPRFAPFFFLSIFFLFSSSSSSTLCSTCPFFSLGFPLWCNSSHFSLRRHLLLFHHLISTRAHSMMIHPPTLIFSSSSIMSLFAKFSS